MKNFLNKLLIALFLISQPYHLLSNDTISDRIEQTEEEDLPVKAKIISEHHLIPENEPFSVVLSLNIQDGWHTYWKNPGDSGMPISIEWELPNDLEIEAIHWPTPKRFDHDGLIGFGYEKELHLLIDLKPTKKLTLNEKKSIKATIQWLACSDMNCFPGHSEVFSELTVGNEKRSLNDLDLFKKARQNLPMKDGQINAQLKSEKLIELNIKTSNDETISYKGSYFCPETDFIDHKPIHYFENLTLNESNNYKVNLNRLNHEKLEDIKGILVLFHDNGTSSYSVDIPVSEFLFPHDETSIGFVDKSEIQNQLSKKPIIQESEFENNFGLALLFAFIGGMILNLMPCVLPVLSLKIFSFVKMSGHSRSLCLKHGLAFSVGVLLSFWVLAGALLILQAYGKSVGWGFQLQEPIFVAILASIIFILGLNLFGVMELGTSVTSMAGNVNTKQEGLTSSFLSGVLATAIATPCTGPFLGSAVGYAFTLPPHLAILIFTMLGVGMAFPYLLLSGFPNLLRFIPKPGNWMITFKEIMGFLMMATTIWLLWVFGAETSHFGMVLLVIALLSFSVACWIYGKWSSPIRKKLTRRLGYLFSLGFFLFGVFVIEKATSFETFETSQNHDEIASNWEPFSPERIRELQSQGIPVFVDFTAKWCLICQTNHLALTTKESENKFDETKVVRMKADWTKNDPLITKELNKFGRSSVPLYVLYGTDQEESPKILPQVLTSDIVIDYLNELK